MSCISVSLFFYVLISIGFLFSLSLSFFIFIYFFFFYCRRLRTELQLIRRKGAIKINGGGSLDRPNIETNLSCARCRIELGRIINRGAPCRSCRLRVCKGCREFSTHTTDWVCIVCHKQM